MLIVNVVVLLFYIFWGVISFLVQGETNLRTKIKSLDVLSILPNWTYDDFQSYIQMGDHSGTIVGTEWITLNSGVDLNSAMLDLAHELNNADNDVLTGQLASEATQGTITEAAFATACGQIEMNGILDQVMVSQEIGTSSQFPQTLVDMVAAYESGEFTLSYLQNWAYSNYGSDMTAKGNGQSMSEYYQQLYNSYR